MVGFPGRTSPHSERTRRGRPDRARTAASARRDGEELGIQGIRLGMTEERWGERLDFAKTH